MGVKAFLENFVEGALFADLKTMRTAAPPKGDESGWGYLGYPIVMTVSAGIELLGVLTSAHPPKQSAVNFVHYWQRYLYPSPSERRDAGDAVYTLARCGITHNFASKMPRITKGGPHHLVRVDGALVIDCVQLADDFEASYRINIRPILEGVAKDGVDINWLEQRLEKLIDVNNRQIDEHDPAVDALAGVAPVFALAPNTSSLDGLNTGATDDVRTVLVVPLDRPSPKKP